MFLFLDETSDGLTSVRQRLAFALYTRTRVTKPGTADWSVALQQVDLLFSQADECSLLTEDSLQHKLKAVHIPFKTPELDRVFSKF